MKHRVVARYLAAASKVQQQVVEVLRKGGYLTGGRRAQLFDKNGRVILPFIPGGTFLSLLKQNVLNNDDAWMRANPDEPRHYILNPRWGKKRPRKKAGPPEGATGYVQMGVLAGAYTNEKLEVTLTHAIWVDDGGGWLGDKTVCNKILLDRMSDSGDDDLSCKVCAARVRKHKLPRMKRFEH